jgi:hypothetical protein
MAVARHATLGHVIPALRREAEDDSPGAEDTLRDAMASFTALPKSLASSSVARVTAI